MDLKQLETFCTIVQNGSFVKAAEKLQYAPSTITLHIQSLEEKVGTALFVRQGKNVTLTDIGREFYEQARAVLHQMSRLEASMRELVQEGTLQIAIGSVEPTASVRLPKLLQQFLRGYPHIKMRLEAGGTLGLSARIRKGHVAFAITTPPPKSSNLIFEPLLKEPLVVLLPESHALSNQKEIRLQQLAAEPFLLSEIGCSYREEIERVFNLKGVHLQPKAEIASGQAVKSCVQLGMGVAMVPALSVTKPPARTVVRHIGDEELSLVTGITYSPERHWNEAESALYKLVKESLRAI